MKTQSNNLLKAIGKTVIESITYQELDKMTKGIYESNFKLFTSVDLWNIQRRRRSLMIR